MTYNVYYIHALYVYTNIKTIQYVFVCHVYSSLGLDGHGAMYCLLLMRQFLD